MNPHLPWEAEVVERIQESPTIFTLRLRLVDEEARKAYRFAPGQFNMVYLYGAGEVPISIASDPQDTNLLGHTIRAVGRVTEGLSRLATGERLGLRGPYGRGWPLAEAEGKDIVVVTGGLGCAPVVGVINYIIMRRERFGRLTVIQGVKHAEELIWRERYAYWNTLPDTQVLLAADHGGPLWPWHVGLVTEVFDQMEIAPERTVAMMCGPEGMMRAAVRNLTERGLAEDSIYLSMERNMQCAIGQCGHCQFGASFICRQGPVFAYFRIKELLGVRGF
ncbi:MAG: FAD/NAD(P)-binding protein [Gammaproteobacteria bacterium]|nr:FAD/NAD(P)-binding protein [Gammaproteobacteria bacterium]